MIITLPVIPWGFLWQRPQQLCSELGSAGVPVMYVATFSDTDRKQNHIERTGSPHLIEQIAPNVFHYWVYVTTELDIHKAPPTSKQSKEIRAALSELLEDYPEITPTLLLHHPAWLSTCRTLVRNKGWSLVYDCMDDHHGFENVDPASLKDEDKLFEQADLVLVTSAALKKKAERFSQKVEILPNAADVEHFSDSVQNTTLPEKLGKKFSKKGKIVGYFGAIKEWFDLDLIEKLSAHFEDCQFVLLGTPEAENFERVADLSNVHFLGRVEYSDLPGYLAHFDVCLIPFVLSPLIEATNPVKFFEYIAAGKPVVSTQLPELETYKDICYLAKSHQEFCSKLNDALAEDSQELEKKRKEVALEHSWHARSAVLLSLLEKFDCDSEAPAQSLLSLVGTLAYQAMTLSCEDHSNAWQRECTRIAEERDKMLKETENFWREEVDSRQTAFTKERERLISERDALIEQNTAEWVKEVEKRSGEFQAEITRIAGERDKMLEELELSWRRKVQEVSRQYQERMTRMVSENETTIENLTRAWSKKLAG